MEIRVLGVQQAQRYLSEREAVAFIVGERSAAVGTPIVYGWGMEFGRYRNDKLARKAGGAFYLTAAANAMRAQAPSRIARAFTGTPGAMLALISDLADEMIAIAKPRAPFLSGDLRKSIRKVFP